MIARTLPSLDQMLGAIPTGAASAGDTAGASATSFDQLMASLTLPQAGQQAAPQPGKMAPVSFQPMTPNAAPTKTEAATFALPIATESAPVLPGNVTLGKAKPGNVGTDNVIPNDGKVSKIKSDSISSRDFKVIEAVQDDVTSIIANPQIPAETSPPVTAQVAADPAAAVPNVAGMQVPVAAAVILGAPVQTAATPAKAEAAVAILQNAVAQPVAARPAKAMKAADPSLVAPASDQPAARPFTLDANNDATTTLEQPVATEVLLTKTEAAPVILLYKQTPDAIALPAAAPAIDIVATQTELASQSLETRLDVARDAQWIDRAAKDIAQLANGEGRLRFRLDPDHLGSLQIDMANGSDGLSMRVTTETEAARLILADAQPRLIAEARAQGVRIAEAHIDMGQQSSGGGRQAPQEQTLINRNQTFESETAETTAQPSSERFA